MRSFKIETRCSAHLQMGVLADIGANIADLEIGATKVDPRFLQEAEFLMIVARAGAAVDAELIQSGASVKQADSAGGRRHCDACDDCDEIHHPILITQNFGSSRIVPVGALSSSRSRHHHKIDDFGLDFPVFKDSQRESSR